MKLRATIARTHVKGPSLSAVMYFVYNDHRR